MPEKGGKGKNTFPFCNGNVTKRYWFIFFVPFISKARVLLLFADLTEMESKLLLNSQPSILQPNAESTDQLLQQLGLMILDSYCSCHVLGHKKERGRIESSIRREIKLAL